MRTDAKIGFAIGGVLLAVLTVYAIVVPKHKKPNNTTVSLVTSAPAADPAPSTPPQLGAQDSAVTPAPPAPLVLPKPNTDVENTQTPPTSPVLGANNSASLSSGVSLPDSSMNPDPIPSNVLQGAKNLTKGQSDRTGNLLGDVYTPPGSKSRKTARSSGSEVPSDDSTPSNGSADRSYTIKSGQTLSKIAYEVYGNSRYWVAIQRENKGLDSNHLKVGSKINLPDITPPGPITIAEEQSPDSTLMETPVHHQAVIPAGSHTYIVKSGDSLYGIARRVLGAGKKSEMLYSLNKDAIGPDESKLKLGLVLKLPENSAAHSAAAQPSLVE